MSDLPGYDQWKLATPPWYDEPSLECEGCCIEFSGRNDCPMCGAEIAKDESNWTREDYEADKADNERDER